MIRVVVADDHAVVRDGFRRLIDSDGDMEVIGEATDGREAVEMCKKLRPDVLVLDYDMPEVDGLEATRQIVDLKLGAKILILTMFDRKELALSLIKSGASGYLCKKASGMELLMALRKAAAGEIYFSASHREQKSSRDDVSGEQDLHSILSNREYQIFIRMARGMTMREVSQDLNISYSTVRTFKCRIMQKLDLKKDSDMTFYAIENRLIERDK